MRRIKDMGGHEGRQRCAVSHLRQRRLATDSCAVEFSGTLLGFDDFVSKSKGGDHVALVTDCAGDMVLEDVVE